VSYLTRTREIAGLTLYEVPRHVPVSVVRLAHYEEGLDEAPAELLRAMLDCPRFDASRPALSLHLLLSTMTARQVAQRLGCFDTDVSRWRTGRRLIPVGYHAGLIELATAPAEPFRGDDRPVSAQSMVAAAL
jgi:transcriptional regulator with XRE-family HTH domain